MIGAGGANRSFARWKRLWCNEIKAIKTHVRHCSGSGTDVTRMGRVNQNDSYSVESHIPPRLMFRAYTARATIRYPVFISNNQPSRPKLLSTETSQQLKETNPCIKGLIIQCSTLPSELHDNRGVLF
jgi:hypothetical protein